MKSEIILPWHVNALVRLNLYLVCLLKSTQHKVQSNIMYAMKKSCMIIHLPIVFETLLCRLITVVHYVMLYGTQKRRLYYVTHQKDAFRYLVMKRRTSSH